MTVELSEAPAAGRPTRRMQLVFRAYDDGVALRYMPATSHFDRRLKPVDGKTGVAVNFAQRPLWLVKGRDVCGRNDFSVGHPH